MTTEIRSDVTEERLYPSAYLSEFGWSVYPQMLFDAADNGNPATLTSALERASPFKRTYPRRSKNGTMIDAKVPSNAAANLAEGEFNRFYMRGLALEAALSC